MKSTHSFAIDFIIRLGKENKKRELIYARITVDGERIYARITVDGERKEIPLKEHINTEDWDNAKAAVKGKSVKVKELNHYLEDVRYWIVSKYRMLEESGALVTAEIVKEAFLDTHAIQKGHQLKELLEYYFKIWEDKLKEGSLKNYRTTIRYIRLFIDKFYSAGICFFHN